MKFIVNLTLLVVLALCVWSGFRHGLIRSIISLLAIVVALIASSLIADAYSRQIVPALNPFINGVIDSQTTNDAVLDNMGYGESDYSLNDILEQDTSLRYDYAYECLRYIGFCRDVSVDLAQDCVTISDKKETTMTDATVTVACNTIAYVGTVTVAFIMILILIIAVVDLFNFDLRLKNIPVLDEVGGSAMGLLKGFLFCVLISWLLGFMGALIGKKNADTCALLNFFQAFRFITRSLI